MLTHLGSPLPPVGSRLDRPCHGTDAEWRLQFQAHWEMQNPRTDGPGENWALPQSGAPRRLPSALGRQRAPDQEGRPASVPGPLIGHRSLRRPPRSRERREPAGQSRRGTPGCAGALESGRGRGGSRSRDLWDARFGGGRTPKTWPPVIAQQTPAECTEGTPPRPRPPALLSLLPGRLPAPAPAGQKARFGRGAPTPQGWLWESLCSTDWSSKGPGLRCPRMAWSGGGP